MQHLREITEVFHDRDFNSQRRGDGNWAEDHLWNAAWGICVLDVAIGDRTPA